MRSAVKAGMGRIMKGRSLFISGTLALCFASPAFTAERVKVDSKYNQCRADAEQYPIVHRRLGLQDKINFACEGASSLPPTVLETLKEIDRSSADFTPDGLERQLKGIEAALIGKGKVAYVSKDEFQRRVSERPDDAVRLAVAGLLPDKSDGDAWDIGLSYASGPYAVSMYGSNDKSDGASGANDAVAQGADGAIGQMTYGGFTLGGGGGSAPMNYDIGKSSEGMIVYDDQIDPVSARIQARNNLKSVEKTSSGYYFGRDEDGQTSLFDEEGRAIDFNGREFAIGSKGGEFGTLGKLGQWISPPRFDQISICSEGGYAVLKGKNFKIDGRGEVSNQEIGDWAAMIIAESCVRDAMKEYF